MTIWSAEIKDLKNLYQTFKGQHPKLDKELDKLTTTDDENMALVYARRCLEVMITDLCETELNRSRGTEPLKGIIDKLNKEEKVPHNIIVSMLNLNSLSSFGAHPKDFDPRQVKPVLLDLITVLEWYLKHLDSKDTGGVESVQLKEVPKKLGKKIIFISGGIIVCAIIVVLLFVFDVIGDGKKSFRESIGSIVVLPFTNYTGDDEFDILFSGMHSSLIGDMGKIGSLRTIGSTSSKIYKDVDLSVTQIATELNVEAALETDIMCFGDTICLQARLISAGAEEKQLWVGEYKEEKSKIMNMFNQLTKQIADEISIELTPEELRILTEYKIVDKEAYDAYLRGHYYWSGLDNESLRRALDYLNYAVERDPNWAPPYAGLAQVWVGLAQMGFESPSIAIPKIYENINMALKLNPDFPDSHFINGIIAVWTEWNWEKGEEEFLHALKINPNDAMSQIYYAHLLWILKRYDEAHLHSQMAFELDPMNPLVLALSANVDCHGRIQQSLEKSNKALGLDPENYYALLSFEGASYLNSDFKNAIETELKICPGLDDEAREAIMAVFQDKGYVEAINTLLTYVEEYAKTNYIGPYEMGEYYYRVGNLDKFIECYIKGYEIHDPMMPYITLSVNGFDLIKDDPRIISIVEKMNLPFTAPN